MAETSYPYEDGTPLGEDQWSALVSALSAAGGVVALPAIALADSLKPGGTGVGLTSYVGPGASIVGGTYHSSDARVNFTHDLNPGSLARVDRIVVRADATANLTRLAIRKGTPGAGAPALSRTGTVVERKIARVTIAAGSGTIDATDVVDEREFSRRGVLPVPAGMTVDGPQVGDLRSGVVAPASVEQWTGTKWVELVRRSLLPKAQLVQADDVPFAQAQGWRYGVGLQAASATGLRNGMALDAAGQFLTVPETRDYTVSVACRFGPTQAVPRTGYGTVELTVAGKANALTLWTPELTSTVSLPASRSVPLVKGDRLQLVVSGPRGAVLSAAGTFVTVAAELD